MTDRIKHLDGLRGFAILMVVLYHVFERWTDRVPYGDDYSGYTITTLGYLGVQLFFLISGFVILLTLENSSNGLNFIKRRWLRLFPAMLAGTVFICIISFLFPDRPSGQVTIANTLPGLTFIQPLFWQALGFDLMSLEGAFWSLYVEVQFYIFAAILYFSFGRRVFIGLTIAAFVFSAIILNLESILIDLESALIDHPLFKIVLISVNLSTFKHFGWFAAGCLFFLYSKGKEKQYLYSGIVLGFASATQLEQPGFIHILGGAVITLLFAASLKFRLPKLVLSNRIFLFFGFISYPLYLIHENLLIASIIKIDLLFPAIPHVLLPLITFAGVTIFAYLIARFAEPAIRRPLANSLKPRQARIAK